VLEEARTAANTVAPAAAAAAQRVNPGGAHTPPANLPRLASIVPCAQCQKRGAGLICAGCEQRWYCARPCQRRHWKAGHKNECDRSKDKAVVGGELLGASAAGGGGKRGGDRAAPTSTAERRHRALAADAAAVSVTSSPSARTYAAVHFSADSKAHMLLCQKKVRITV
jgi:hypothetical protein